MPGVEEGTSYGTPAFRVRGKLLARLSEYDDVLMVKVELDYRGILIGRFTEIYFTTPHYDECPTVLVHLHLADGDELRDLLTDAWGSDAPKRMVAEFGKQEYRNRGFGQEGSYSRYAISPKAVPILRPA